MAHAQHSLFRPRAMVSIPRAHQFSKYNGKEASVRKSFSSIFSGQSELLQDLTIALFSGTTNNLSLQSSHVLYRSIKYPSTAAHFASAESANVTKLKL